MTTFRRLVASLGLALAFVGFASLGNAQSTDNSEFTFGFLSDTHLGTSDTTSTPGAPTVRMKKAIEQMNARDDIEFVIFGGDATIHPYPDQQAAFKETAKFKQPWYPVAGNHDVGNTITMRLVNQWIDLGMGRGEPARDYYGFTHGDAAFYVLDAFPANANDTTATAHIEAMLQACDEFFETYAGAKHKIMLAHPPLFIKELSEPDAYFNISTPLRMKIADIMKRRDVKTWLSGHRHLTDKVTDPESGITVYSQPSSDYPIGEGQKAGYAIFTLGDKGLTREIIVLE